MNIKLNDKIIQNPNVVSRTINNKEVLLINYENSSVFLLNFTGLFLWNLLSVPTEVNSLLKIFQRKYQIDFQQAKKDLIKFISDLFKERFIVLPIREKIFKKFPPSFSDKLWDKVEPIAEEKKFPALAEIAVTDKCNLSCVHCYVVKEKKPIMSLQMIKNVIDQLEQAGCFFLTFTGGEPFLRKDFLDILNYAQNKKFSIDILSNGTLITPKIAKKLAKIKINRIQISIYSAIPKIHNSITGKNNSFKKSKKAIKLLHNNKIKVHLACLVMSLNFLSYKTVKKLAKKMGVKSSVAYPVRARHNGKKDTYRLRLNEKQLKQFILDNKKEVCQQFTKETNKRICHAGSAICFISSTGDVTPCVLFPMSVGSLYNKKFIEIWEKSPFLKKFRSLTISSFLNCKNCKFLQFCRVCPGLNYLEEGNILKPVKINCQFAKIAKQVFDKKLKSNI